MKKVILLLAGLLTLLCFCSCNNTPKESPASDFQYKISDDGQSVSITKYLGNSRNVVIPSEIDGRKVLSILSTGGGSADTGAFEGCNIQSVTIPDSVAGIGWHAFKDCKELTEVKLSRNLRDIGGFSFQNCVKLKSFDFSKTVLRSIGTGTFDGCGGLEEVKLPETLSEIGDIAFRNCTSLLEIDLPDGLKTVGNGAFGGCKSLKTMKISKTLDLSILQGEACVYDTPALEKIIFKDGWEDIRGYAFFGIASNTEIMIPKSVKKFSPLPFSIISGSSARFVFEGDCPEITDPTAFYTAPTICYDPNTKGWDDCVWKDKYPMIPTK